MFHAVEKKLRNIGQEHLLNGFDTLSEPRKIEYLNELNAINISEISAKLTEGYATALLNDNEDISPFSGPSLNIVDLDYANFLQKITSNDSSCDDVEVSLYNEGLRMISENQVCVVLMAGGQGTRLGFNKPKGLYEIGVLSHDTIFSLHANSIKCLIELTEKKTHVSNIRIPLLIMTSSVTHGATKEYFKEMNFFGLPEDSVIFFQQGVLPTIEYVDIDATTKPETIITTADGSQKSIKIVASAPGCIAYSPNGNGGIYSSLKRYSEVIQSCKFVHVIGVDNILVKIADPLMVGYISRNNLDVVNKVVIRENTNEKVGVMAVKSNRPCIVEYSELGSEKA